MSFIVYGPTGHGEWYNYDSTFLYDFDLNDADDTLAFGFAPTKNSTGTKFGFTIETLIGTVPNYEIGAVTVEYDASEYTSVPTTTLYGGSSWQTFVPVSAGWNWVTLSSYITITAGDQFAFVIRPTTPAPDSSNFMSIRYGELWFNYPWGPEHYTSTSVGNWNDLDGPGPAAVLLSDGDALGFPVDDLASFTYQSPEEWGLEFTLPVGATCLGAGIIHEEEAFGTDVPYKVLLTDASDSILRQDIVTNSEQYGGGYDSEHTFHYWEEIELSAGTTYRLILKPTSVKYVMGVGLELLEEKYKSCLPLGTDWKWIYRPAPTSGWQTTPEKYPWISVLLTNIGGSVVDNSYGFIG